MQARQAPLGLVGARGCDWSARGAPASLKSWMRRDEEEAGGKQDARQMRRAWPRGAKGKRPNAKLIRRELLPVNFDRTAAERGRAGHEHRTARASSTFPVSR
jgi:hypothetical protein